MLLEIRDLHVAVEGKPILKGVNLKVEEGHIHALMGPNGSGKSTLSNVLMGHPKYRVTQGCVIYKGEDITADKPHVRARKGLFLAFQYPTAIPGVTVANFVRTALKSVKGDAVAVKSFRKTLRDKLELLEMSEAFASRYVNDGFSGGEKKRLEILQMALLEPQLAILDETDSGLDIDALRIVSNGINKLMGPHNAALLITHYQRILDYVKPHFVHVLMNGQIIQSGGPEMARELEKKGYDWLKPEEPSMPSAPRA